MTSDIRDILGHTNVFNDIEEIDQIEKIGSSKYKITRDNKAYVFALYNLDQFDDIENEAIVNEVLEGAGLNPLTIYDKGLMPDIERSFKVYEYRNEISLYQYLDKVSCEDQFVIGKEFGKALRKLHNIKGSERVNWQQNFLVRSNKLFYRHGLSEIGDDDYILIDYINANKHLTENTALNLLYKNISDKNIRIYEDEFLDLRAIKELEYGDGIVDFVEINRIAINFSLFAKGVLDSYFDGDHPTRKFYRLLSLYQATAILESLINMREKLASKLSKDEVDSLLEMYDNFNRITPSWVD